MEHSQAGRRLFWGFRIDEDLGPEHGVGDVEKGVIGSPGVGDELEVGGQQSRKQEDPKQPVIPITAAETVGRYVGGEDRKFPLDSSLV